jgi:hypothetical protein
MAEMVPSVEEIFASCSSPKLRQDALAAWIVEVATRDAVFAKQFAAASSEFAACVPALVRVVLSSPAVASCGFLSEDDLWPSSAHLERLGLGDVVDSERRMTEETLRGWGVAALHEAWRDVV